MKKANLFYEKLLFEKINILDSPEALSVEKGTCERVETVAPITQLSHAEPVDTVPMLFSRPPALSNFANTAHYIPTNHNGVNGRKFHWSENSFFKRVAPSRPISQRFFIPVTPPPVMGMGLRVRRFRM